MGYQSRVSLGLTEKAFNGYLRKYPEALTLCKEADNILVHDDQYIFYWDDLKWYPTYKDVSELEKFMAELDKVALEEGGSYCSEEFGFIRLGEDYDDYEEKGSPYIFDFYHSRILEIPDWDTIEFDKIFKNNSEKYFETIMEKDKK